MSLTDIFLNLSRIASIRFRTLQQDIIRADTIINIPTSIFIVYNQCSVAYIRLLSVTAGHQIGLKIHMPCYAGAPSE